jgi:hypothetical protein
MNNFEERAYGLIHASIAVKQATAGCCAYRLHTIFRNPTAELAFDTNAGSNTLLAEE